MGHVREEIRLVLAFPLEFLSPEPHDIVHTLQIVALVLELLPLLLELRLRLLEFGLLDLEARLRLFQRSTLLLELLVRDPELFALRLKLFGLTLGFFQKVLQLRAIVGGANGDADSLRHLFEKGLLSFLERVYGSKVQHR